MNIFLKRFLLMGLISVLTLCEQAKAFECLFCPNGLKTCKEADIDIPVALVCNKTEQNACFYKQDGYTKEIYRSCTVATTGKCGFLDDPCTCTDERCNKNWEECTTSCHGPRPTWSPPSGQTSPQTSGHQAVPAYGVLVILSVFGAGISSGFWKLH